MSVPQLARIAARRLAPGYMADRARRYERSIRRREGVPDLARRLLAGAEPAVQGGPFVGMRYPADRLLDIDAAVAKLVGVYEQEIAWVFERAIANRVSAFIDIGCADGYYAVGMAHACQATTSYAYDLASSARRLCSETAAASGVEGRVQIASRFTHDVLRTVPSDGALLLCDIEGAELDVFDPSLAASLVNTVVVIEVHEDERPGTSAQLKSVFASTHNPIAVAQERRVHVPQALAAWSPADRARGLAEFRGPNLHWLVLEPKLSRQEAG